MFFACPPWVGTFLGQSWSPLFPSIHPSLCPPALETSDCNTLGAHLARANFDADGSSSLFSAHAPLGIYLTDTTCALPVCYCTGQHPMAEALPGPPPQGSDVEEGSLVLASIHIDSRLTNLIALFFFFFFFFSFFFFFPPFPPFPSLPAAVAFFLLRAWRPPPLYPICAALSRFCKAPQPRKRTWQSTTPSVPSAQS